MIKRNSKEVECYDRRWIELAELCQGQVPTLPVQKMCVVFPERQCVSILLHFRSQKVVVMTIACITVFQLCNISSVVFMKFSFILSFMLSYILSSNIECSHLFRMKGNEQKTWEAVCCSGEHGELMDNWLFLEQLVSIYVHVVVILKVFLQPCKSQGWYSDQAVGKMNKEFGFAFWQGQEILLVSRESRPVLGLSQSYSVGTRGSFLSGKVSEACCSPPTPVQNHFFWTGLFFLRRGPNLPHLSAAFFIYKGF